MKNGINTEPPKRSRIKREDRNFSPPDLGWTPKGGEFRPIEMRPAALAVAEGIYKLLRSKRRDFRAERVYASGIKNCVRQQMMGIAGFRKDPVGENNPEWLVSADLGEWLHNKVEGWLKEIGGSVHSEFNVRSGDDTLGGRVDHTLADQIVEVKDIPTEKRGTRTVQKALRSPEDYQALVEVAGELYVLDAKTVGAKDFREGAWGRKVPGYVAQITTYGTILGITKGIVLMVCRDNGEMMDMEFDIDPEYGKYLLRRAKGVVDWSAMRRLPPAEEWTDKGASFVCNNFCPFYTRCAVQQRTGKVQELLDAGFTPFQIDKMVDADINYDEALEMRQDGGRHEQIMLRLVEASNSN